MSNSPDSSEGLDWWFSLSQEERDQLSAKAAEDFARSEVEHGPDYPEWLR